MKNPKLGMLTKGSETSEYSQSVTIIILAAHDVRQVIWAKLHWAMDRTVFKFIDLCKEASRAGTLLVAMQRSIEKQGSTAALDPGNILRVRQSPDLGHFDGSAHHFSALQLDSVRRSPYHPHSRLPILILNNEQYNLWLCRNRSNTFFGESHHGMPRSDQLATKTHDCNILLQVSSLAGRFGSAFVQVSGMHI